MTAGELIGKLAQLEPHTRVLVDGYEDGYSNIRHLQLVDIVPGPRGDCGDWTDGKHADHVEEALVLSRYAP